MDDQVIGIDLSSRKVAAVVLEDDSGEPFVETLLAIPKREARGSELLVLSHKLKEFFEQVMPRYVYVESPVVGRGGARPTILQAQVDGLVQARAIEAGHHRVYSVNNKTWKKDVVGNGNASKGESAAWLAAHHPVLADLCGADQDLVDAAGVALYGSLVVSRAREL